MNNDVLKLLEEALADPASAKQRRQQLRAENDALLAAMPEDERRIKKIGAEVMHAVADKTINETLFAACGDLFDEGTWRAAFQNLANAKGIQPFAQIVAAMGAPSTLADTSATDVLDAASALLKTPKA